MYCLQQRAALLGFGTGAVAGSHFQHRKLAKTCIKLAPKYAVSGINTNVIVALNGSIDGTNWSKVIENQTITSNGTSHYNVANHPVQYIQPVFVSESGGTAAEVLFSIGATA